MNFFDFFDEKKTWVRLLDDRKYWTEKPPLEMVGKIITLEDLIMQHDRVDELNKKGLGVFFMANESSTGHGQKDITAIKWIYIEMDDGSKLEQMKKIENSPIPPNMIIESKRSYHCYWRCDLTQEQFDELGSGMVYYFNSDPSFTRIGGVMRMPHFYHFKYPKEPFKITTIKCENTIFKYEDLIKKYQTPINSWKNKFNLNQDDLDIIKQIPIKNVLDKLGVQYNSQNFLIENGEITSASINVKQNYINRFSGKPPCGSSVDVVMYFMNLSVADAINWLKDAFLIKPLVKEATINKTLVKKERYDLRYTWGTQDLNNNFAIIKRDSLIVCYGTRGQGKTTYIFDMATKNAELGHKVLFLSLEMQQDKIIDDLCRRYAGITIEEEYNYRIPIEKTRLYEKRKKEILDVKNLMFRGMRGDDDKSMQNIQKIILECADVDLVVIDNLDLIEKDAREDNNTKQNRVIKDLMSFSTKYSVPIVLLHHQRKFSEKNTNKQSMDDMSGSGKVADTADYVVKVVRDTDPLLTGADKYKTTLMLVKARGYYETFKDIYFNKGTFADFYTGDVENHWTQKY